MSEHKSSWFRVTCLRRWTKFLLSFFFSLSLCREGLSDSNKSPVRCDKDWTPPCGGNQAQHRSWLIPSPQWSMVLLSAPERTFSMEKLAPQHSNLTPRWRFLFQQDDDIKRSWGNEGLASGRRRKSSRDPDLNPTEHLWRDVTLNVFKLMDLERSCSDDQETPPKRRCAELRSVTL